jgi:hypothetical protein
MKLIEFSQEIQLANSQHASHMEGSCTRDGGGHQSILMHLADFPVGPEDRKNID